MKIIKYFNKELVKYEKVKEKQKQMEYDKEKGEMVEVEKEVEVEKPIFEIKPLKYLTIDKESEKWYNHIKTTYGEYGEVTIEDGGADPKTKEEIMKEAIEAFKQSIAELSLQLVVKDITDSKEEH